MKMQDMASPVADRIAKSVTKASETVDRWRSNLTRASRSSQEFSGQLVVVKSKVDALQSSRGFSSIVERAKQALRSVSALSDKAEQLNKELFTSNGKMSGIASKARLIATALVGFSLVSFVNDATAAYTEMQNIDRVIQFTGGKDGAKNIQFVNDIAKELKLPLLEAKEGFKQFSGATMGTALEGEKTRNVFKSVSIAAAGMGLTGDNTKGVFLALGQIMSKGKVSAEELRGQLGERMPGAFNIAARAMGVTQSELDKMMANGELLAADFLPRFANELERTYAGALPGYFKSAQAFTNDYNNQLQKFKVDSGEALTPLKFRFMQLGSTIMDKVLPIIISVAGFINENWGPIKDTVYALSLAFAVGAVALAVYKVYTIGAMIASQGFTAAMTSLNLAFLANPVTWIVIGIMAFVATIVLAYQRVGWFRGAIYGLWEAAKTVFSNIGDFFKRIFDPIFKAIDAFKRGDFASAAKFAAQGLFNLTPVGLAVEAVKTASSGGFTKGVGESFNKGYKQGVAEIAAKKANEKQSTSMFGSFAQTFMGDSEQASSGGTESTSATPSSASSMSGGSGASSSKPKSITIHISNLVRVDNFNGSSDDGKKQVTDTVIEALIRAVTGAQIVLEGNE